MITFLKQFNLFFWSGPMMILLFGTHIYFTFHLHFVQRKVCKGMRAAFRNMTTLTTTLAATLGTGNIIGVGTAVYLGGPGAVFWCWLTGLLGMATTYSEAYLSIKYKDSKSPIGGPMYMLKNGCHKKFLSILYAIAVCLAAFCIGGMTQSNAITMITSSLFPFSSFWIGIIIAILIGCVLLKDVTAIESICGKLVPIMGFFFLGGCLLLLILGHDFLIPALIAIGKGAFSYESIGGGVLGYSLNRAVRYGVARGLFTNEAGLGTAGIIASSGGDNDIESTALVSMCATFFDTVVLCAITGVAITIYVLQYPETLPAMHSGQLTMATFSTLPFYGVEILGISTIAFALATIIGWSYIGYHAAFFLGKEKGVKYYKIIYLLLVFLGSVVSFEFVWELTDFINLFLALPCLYALLTLRKELPTRQ